MAIYDFKCRSCGDIIRDVTLSMLHTREERPRCCGAIPDTYISKPPQVHWKDYDVNYVPVSVKNAPPITSRRQEREFMARHGLIHAELPPPSAEEDLATKQQIQASIEAISAPSEEIARQLDIV